MTEVYQYKGGTPQPDLTELDALKAPIDDAEIAEIEDDMDATRETARQAVVRTPEWVDRCETLLRAYRQAEAERDALREYARHKSSCEGIRRTKGGWWKECTCGLAELLGGSERIDQDKKNEQDKTTLSMLSQKLGAL